MYRKVGEGLFLWELKETQGGEKKEENKTEIVGKKQRQDNGNHQRNWT